jgi:putative ABC transport system permease protein
MLKDAVRGTVVAKVIMNIMLMNAIERRREIGLRADVGASPYDIRAMFVAEAAILSCGGGIAGTVLGLCIAWAVALASSWAFSVALYALPLGVGLATAIGIVSRAYPA